MQRRGFIGSIVAALACLLAWRIPASAAPTSALRKWSSNERLYLGIVESKLPDGQWLVRCRRAENMQDSGPELLLTCGHWMEMTDLLSVAHEDCHPVRVTVWHDGDSTPLVVGVAVEVMAFVE